MLYNCGTEIKEGDVVGQTWYEMDEAKYLGTVIKVRNSSFAVKDNCPVDSNTGSCVSSDVRFLRRKDDVRVGDWIWILKDQAGAPEGAKVLAVEVETNLTVIYEYNNTNFLVSSIHHYLLASLTGMEEKVSPIPSDRCSCGGLAIQTGFNTLIITVCSICKKEK